MALQLITTGDGSHSLLNTELNETYHSVHGAVRESLHVFIKNGIEFYIQINQPEQLNILEIGFGTGLNTLLTLKHTQDSKTNINYTSIEAFPISLEIANQLSYPSDILLPNSVALFQTLHKAVWNEPVSILPNFVLKKWQTVLQEIDLEKNKFDLIYFDAFAPNKQPEMWEISILKKVVDSLTDNGIFVTYCAKGQLKRDLKSLGLVVESLAGPPGKREMIRATKVK